ncbi:UNVERIFIED_CONTAM: hypothetical protein HDU68_006434 [Siphonaria sp. JEL0065]|nr:hypothetical protein HDU68_006434 [Siphonaria sp. JEL0065]
MLQTLLSLLNLKQQLAAAVSASKECSALFDSTNENQLVLPLLIKTQLKKTQMLLSLLQTDQMDQLNQSVFQLQTIKKEALSLMTSSPSDLNLMATAIDIDSLAGMYDSEVRILSVLVSEVKLGSGYSHVDEDDLSKDEAHITIERVIKRWKTVLEVDLVFEGQLMERARNAAEANAAI